MNYRLSVYLDSLKDFSTSTFDHLFFMVSMFYQTKKINLTRQQV